MLFVAAMGIYAVISYSINQRRAELEIRMALGATTGELQIHVLFQALGLAGLGMLTGSLAAGLVSRAMGSLLFGVKSADPVTFSGMLLLLTMVACFAAYLPALRISRIEPQAALRVS